MSNRFSPEQDKIILDKIKMYPDNISYALELAVDLIGRNFFSVQHRYYKKLRRCNKVITCGSTEGFTSNVKVTHRASGVFPEARELNKVDWLLQEFLQLPKKEKQKIVNLFISTGEVNIKSPRVTIKGNKNKVAIKK